MDASTLFLRLKAAVVTVTKQLNLKGDDPAFAIGGNVLSLMTDDPTNKATPCVVVTHAPGSETLWSTGGTSQHFYLQFPILWMIQDRETQRWHQKEGDYLAWRLAAWTAFDQRQAWTQTNNVPECIRSFVSFGPIIEAARGKFEALQSGLTINCVCKLPRPATI